MAGSVIMDIEIKELRKKDHRAAISFAIKGMNFSRYAGNRLLLAVYGRYFWHLEMSRATQVIAAYAGDKLAGVLLAEMEGQEKPHASWGRTWYVEILGWIQDLFYQEGIGVYEDANKALYARYRESNAPDGEILFLAADPEAQAQGIGSLLLAELERRERGKKIFLYTDDACTYQFYEHRGFERAAEMDVVLDMGRKKTPLKCLLYSKVTA